MKEEEKKTSDMKTYVKEEENPTGPFGLPLDSEKYNPKSLPKYDPSTINFINTSHSMSDCWIVDSSASEHISSNASFFSNIVECEPISIRLPNGTNLSISMKGDVCFTPHITSLHGVYYVPSFIVNLLSVSKLTTFSNYVVNFTKSHVVVLNKVMKRTTGQANMRGGLYYLQHTVPGIPSFGGAVISTIWCHRLGHTSSSRMEYI